MPSLLRDKTDITATKVIPLYGVRIISADAGTPMDIMLHDLVQGSTYSIKEIRKKGRVIAYTINCVARIVYNDYNASDFIKAFEHLSFQQAVDVNIWLKPVSGQAAKGDVTISCKRATVKKWKIGWSIPEQANTKLPEMEITISGLFSIDALKGFNDAYALDSGEVHFFTT